MLVTETRDPTSYSPKDLINYSTCDLTSTPPRDNDFDLSRPIFSQSIRSSPLPGKTLHRRSSRAVTLHLHCLSQPRLLPYHLPSAVAEGRWT